MARFAPRSVNKSSTRRTRAWARQYGTLSLIDGDPVVTSLLNQYELDVGSDIEEGTTIGGFHLQLSLSRDAGSVDTVPAVIMGVRIATRLEDAVDSPPADVVNGGIHLDWMWWHELFYVGDGASPSTTWRRSFEYELGSMRRLPTNQHVPILSLQRPSGASDTYFVRYASSCLLILP